MSSKKYLDGLTNPKVYHRPSPIQKPSKHFSWRTLLVIVIVGIFSSYAIGPRVTLFADQIDLFQTLTNGRYLVLFQNDGESRASGGFIGSFAVIEAKDSTIKPIYFETNIYKLDDPFTAQTKIEPPKPIKLAIGDRGWAMRDANFAADFRQAAPSIEWFFRQEAEKLTGPKKEALAKALNGNLAVDGVIATNMSAFLDLLELVGPISIPSEKVTVNRENFFKVVQQVVEQDYFKDPNNKLINEPKTILQNLFPLAIQKVRTLPISTQYKFLSKLLKEKKIIIYSNDYDTEQTLVKQGWAGSLSVAEEFKPSKPSDFLAVIRSAHGGNKSSLDINPKYSLNVNSKADQTTYSLELTHEHNGLNEWPGGVNTEYIRTLVPKEATLVSATQNGQDILNKIDIGVESDKGAFGFWLVAEPKSSQSVKLQYVIPTNLIRRKKYQLTLIRQAGGNSPDYSVIYNGKQIYLARLTTDRVIRE